MCTGSQWPTTRLPVRHRDRRGVALVVVLALVVSLAAVAAAVGRMVRLEADTAASLRARTSARYAAESGVVAAEWRLQTLLDSVQSAPERAALFRRGGDWLGELAEVALGNTRFRVALADLNARLDLNRSDPVALRALFARFTNEGRAVDIVTAIRARPLYRVAELATVPGMNSTLAAAVAPYITVWSDGSVNLNSAPEPVLAALPAIGESGARNLLMRRDAGEILGLGAGSWTSSAAVSISPTRILVISRGWQDGHPLTHEVQAVYAVAGARLSLLAWQERDL